MTALASSTPIPMTSSLWAGGGADLYRRPSKRGVMRITPAQVATKKTSPLSSGATSASRALDRDGVKAAVGDSSDDEDLAPIKLSAEARELLGEEASQNSASPNGRRNNGGSAEKRMATAQSDSAGHTPGWWEDERIQPSPVSRLAYHSSGTRPQPAAMGRDGSFFYKRPGDSISVEGGINAITPAPQIRTVRINGSRSQTRSPPSSRAVTQTQNDGSQTKPSSNGQHHNPSGGDGSWTAVDDEVAPRGLMTVSRSRRGDDRSMQSTMRAKRAGRMTGSFLNGPLRRGMIRRQSDEEDIQSRGHEHFSQGSPGHIQSTEDHHDENLHHSPTPSPLRRPALGNVNVGDDRPRPSQQNAVISSMAPAMPLSKETKQQLVPKTTSPERPTQPRPASHLGDGGRSSPKTSSARVQSMFKVPPPPPPNLPSAHDQENEPPPTFKKSKPAVSVLGEVHQIAVLGDKLSKHATPATASPQRKALAPRSQNTPHRVAPAPPPKMSVLEAATSAAGSVRSKKKVAWSLNGKLYTRLDCIGRGGSSRVYRVMAENYKMFALKRVNLEDADAASIVGYRGEIDLLKRLQNVERVVRLFDYEINEDRGELKVLMEMGETDFNRMLNLQIKTDNARFDISFTRHYWREMLECVQAVHDHGIVHSDLKPANFLVVQGRLKIIDFGIANAIQDNTVNVHRENQIGTPNYMSPEALVDSNAVNGKRQHHQHQHQHQQLLKLGKPSDVWSLGCILYQMVYGLPPFGHIANAHQRIMSIPNPRVPISFPAVTPTNLGTVPVGHALIDTLKRCLDRDQFRRPSIPDLLRNDDPFLNPPESPSTLNSQPQSQSQSQSRLGLDLDLRPHQVVIDQPMLAQVLQKVVHYCRANPAQLPDDSTLGEWAATFLDRIGKLDCEGVGGT